MTFYDIFFPPLFNAFRKKAKAAVFIHEREPFALFALRAALLYFSFGRFPRSFLSEYKKRERGAPCSLAFFHDMIIPHFGVTFYDIFCFFSLAGFSSFKTARAQSRIT